MKGRIFTLEIGETDIQAIIEAYQAYEDPDDATTKLYELLEEKLENAADKLIDIAEGILADKGVLKEEEPEFFQEARKIAFEHNKVYPIM